MALNWKWTEPLPEVSARLAWDLFVGVNFLRRSSSGDYLSVTPDNLSPGLGPGGGLLANRGAHRSLSSIESASTNVNGNGGQRSSGGTSYHSSTLPLRKQRNKVSVEEKNKKVCCARVSLIRSL